MVLNLHSVWLVPTAFTLLNLGSVASVNAQITYPFQATYDTEIRLTPTSVPNLSQTNGRGESTDAPYGLTNFRLGNYAQVDLNSGVVTYGPDPAAFGLEGPPLNTTVTLFGDGLNKLFGTNDGTISPDLTGSGTITLVGGEGMFTGATGTLNLFEKNTPVINPTGPINLLKAQISISGSFQAVPEPRISATVIGITAIGAGFLLHSRRNSRKRAVLIALKSGKYNKSC
jgi:hypothetical protein